MELSCHELTRICWRIFRHCEAGQFAPLLKELRTESGPTF